MFIKIRFSTNLSVEVPYDSCHSVQSVKQYIQDEKQIHSSCYYIMNEGLPVSEDSFLDINKTYVANLKLNGGKGGFGSMLRAMGSQIEKTTNTESCRDLSGRRMRDVNNEKKFEEYTKNKKANDEEKERKKVENLEKKLVNPKHFFNDPDYDKQNETISDSLDDALKQAKIMKRKNQLEEKTPVCSKKKKVTMFEDSDVSSDSSDDGSDSSDSD